MTRQLCNCPLNIEIAVFHEGYLPERGTYLEGIREVHLPLSRSVCIEHRPRKNGGAPTPDLTLSKAAGDALFEDSF
jgi:hypothetical protein